ncbi:uncharacterized protein LOC110919632 [Helianthus annuus]|uniref:uncharacterized protein LOC110919632 n=1 Tax=Helianthus annuus TaxID=4232 RepID=UPI000B9043F0|nr:uncharacterized protein LOC110919632 [Helianthus annuus]
MRFGEKLQMLFMGLVEDGICSRVITSFQEHGLKIVLCGRKLKVGEVPFVGMIKGSVGNGTKIRFWIDPWIDHMPLKQRFPSLFRLESDYWCVLADRIETQNDGNLSTWDWKRYPTTEQEMIEVVECQRLITGTRLSQAEDSWVWSIGDSKDYLVKEVEDWLKSTGSEEVSKLFEWCKWIPSKCNIFMWRALLDRIPTRCALRRRNISTGHSCCVFCEDVDVTADHLFTVCRFADGVWNGIVSWCRLPPMIMFSVDDIPKIVDQMGGSKSRRSIVYGIFIITCWRIWKARNEKVFFNITRSVSHVVSDVKSLSFLWYRRMGKDAVVDWIVHRAAVLQKVTVCNYHYYLSLIFGDII